MTPLRHALAAFLFVAGVAAALHLAVLGSWHFSIAPELERARHPGVLDRSTIESFPTSRSHWADLSANGLHLRAPILEPAADVIARCARRCQIELEAGRLTLFAEALGEPYEQQVRAMSPARDDIRFLRLPWDNWRSIHSLAVHANLPNALPPTERFVSPSTRGVVTHFNANDNERWVIYAYAARGLASQKLALSGTSRDVLLALLGSLRFAAVPD